MNREQMLLLKVAEECAELAQVCSKAIRFGIYNQRPGQDLTNLTKLQDEFLDLMVAIDLLETTSAISINNGFYHIEGDQLDDRYKRVEQYLQVSRELGILKD